MNKLLLLCLAATALATPANTEASISKKLTVSAEAYRNRQQTFQFQKKEGATAFVTGKKAKAPVKPMKVTPGGTTLYGYLEYSDAVPAMGSYEGIYEVSSTGAGAEVMSDPLRGEELFMNTGWYADDKICSYCLDQDMSTGFLIGYYYAEADFSTGKLTKIKELDPDNGFMMIATYNTADNCIYGFGADFMGNEGWVKAPASNPGEVDIVKELDPSEVCYSLTYNAKDGLFYGVTQEQKFVSITPAGETKVICSLDASKYLNAIVCGLMYSEAEDLFYWNPQFADWSTGLATFDLKGNYKDIAEFADAEQFSYMFTTDKVVDPAKPADPEIVSLSFVNGALSGTMEAKLPSVTGSGAALTGELDWFATIDGELYKTGKAAAGSTVKVEYTSLAAGTHRFGIYVETAGKNRSEETKTSLYVGVDTPASPANVTLSRDKVTWSAVDKGANGGYIDLSALSYEVYVNGELKGTTKATSLAINLLDNEYASYQASVVAVSGGLKSEPGVSNKIVDGRPLDLPVMFTPTQAEYDMMTVVDANKDGRGWSYSPIYQVIKTSFSTNGAPMDDWIFLPAINIPDASRFYTFGMDIHRIGLNEKDELVEVVAFAGEPSPAGKGCVVMEQFQPDAVTGDISKVARFKVDKAGTYFIGIHCISAPDQYGVEVDNIFINDEGIVASSPAAVSGLNAVAMPKGALKANVLFRFPTKDYNGNDLAADLKLTATVTAEKTVTVEGTPGKQATVAVETHQGDNEISVFVSSANGTGPVSKCSVYTGVVAPDRVTGLKMTVSDNMLSATLTWEAPLTGANGGYIDPELVSYKIFRFVNNVFGGDWEPVADAGNDKTYTYTLPAGSPMESVQLGVLASNVAGNSEMISYAMDLMGSPYTLPMFEDFEEEYELAYQPWTVIYTQGVNFGYDYLDSINQIFAGDHESALVGVVNGLATGEIAVPRFSTKGLTGVTVTMKTYAGPKAADVTVKALATGISDAIELSRFPADKNGFVTSEIKLPASLMGKDWVQLSFECIYTAADQIMALKEIRIEGKTDGIGDITAASASIIGTDGAVIVKGHAGDSIEISSVDGRTVASLTAADDAETINLAAGLYIVRAGSQTAKVIVK